MPNSIILFLYDSSWAQIPDEYYNSADGLTGESLKWALHEIIKNHVEFPYTSTSTDVWDILKETDKDTANPNNIILLYSDWSINAAQEYNVGNGWTREHVWAKSHGDFGTSKGAGTDVHHLRPADVSVNSARNNKDFDNGGDIYTDGDGPTECKSDKDSWEPRDAVKGDIARMLFYMAVCYEGEGGEPDLELVDEVNTVDLNETGKGFHGKLSTLLQWHIFDPVDSFEVNRNNVIYTYQKNRNPFIDYPKYVEKIWTVTDLKPAQYQKEITIYPNPAKDFIIIKSANSANIEGTVYSITGQKMKQFQTENSAKIDLTGFENGSYILKIKSKKSSKSYKLVIH